MSPETSPRRKIILAVSLYLLISVIIIFVVLLLTSRPKPVSNLSDHLSSAPVSDLDDFEDTLARFLQETYQTTPTDFEIRSGSYQETKSTSQTTSTFLIDSETLKQSFAVTFTWPADENTSENITVDCAELDQTKYPDSDCVGMYNSTALQKAEEKNAISKLLPLSVYATGEEEREIADDPLYTIYGYFDDNNNFSINIINYEGDNYQDALDQIRSLGFNPEDYIINYAN